MPPLKQYWYEINLNSDADSSSGWYECRAISIVHVVREISDLYRAAYGKEIQSITVEREPTKEKCT